MFCTNCGATLQDGSAFCTSCGRPTASPAPPQAGGPPVGSAPPGTYYPAAQTSKGLSVVAIVLIVLVLLLAVGGIAAWSFFGGFAGSGQLGACVEEWQYQGATRKENWTRGECESFCASGVNPNHLACYFDPYRVR